MFFLFLISAFLSGGNFCACFVFRKSAQEKRDISDIAEVHCKPERNKLLYVYTYVCKIKILKLH